MGNEEKEPRGRAGEWEPVAAIIKKKKYCLSIWMWDDQIKQIPQITHTKRNLSRFHCISSFGPLSLSPCLLFSPHILLIVYTSDAVDFYLFVCCLYHTPTLYDNRTILPHLKFNTFIHIHTHSLVHSHFTHSIQKTNKCRTILYNLSRECIIIIFFLHSFFASIHFHGNARMNLSEKSVLNVCTMVHIKHMVLATEAAVLQSVNEIDTWKCIQWKFSECAFFSRNSN